MKVLREIYRRIINPNTIFDNALNVAFFAALILFLPLTAMFITDEMNWTASDFFAAWVLLASAGFAYRMISRRMKNFRYRAAVGVAVVTALFMVWVNLAVGLIGSEDNSANWMYIGLLTIGFIGSIVVRFKPKGMALVMYTLAFTHSLIVVIALIANMHLSPESPLVEILGVNGFFALLWIGSALLFRNVPQEQTPVNAK